MDRTREEILNDLEKDPENIELLMEMGLYHHFNREHNKKKKWLNL